MDGFKVEWNLGARSIFDRNRKMQKQLNLKIKFRALDHLHHQFLENKTEDWFQIEDSSPYMLLVAQVKEKKLRKKEKNNQGLSSINKIRSTIGVTHIDYSARVQTVAIKLIINC